MKFFYSLVIIAQFIIFSSMANAQEVIALPDGQTVLNISATERVEVEQDTLVASLRIQVEDEEAFKVQKEINTAMKKAVDLAKQNEDLKVETGQYYVSPDYRQVKTSMTTSKREIDKWRGSQTLIIKSKNSQDVLEIVGIIQDMGFVMNGLSYELSKNKYESARETLMEDTIKALQERAQRVAKSLGKSKVDIVEINVDSMPMNPRPVYTRTASKMEMMSMAADSMPAPTAQPGTNDVSMTINARVILSE